MTFQEGVKGEHEFTWGVWLKAPKFVQHLRMETAITKISAQGVVTGELDVCELIYQGLRHVLTCQMVSTEGDLDCVALHFFVEVNTVEPL